MRILYDIVHPADVHFFRQAITTQLGRHDRVLITSRSKDITVELLEQFGLSHRMLTKQGKGPIGLFWELILRDWRLLRVAREFDPDILVSNNSPCVAHVARVLRRPSLIFDDTEIHSLNQLLYTPFVTEVHSPSCYTKKMGRKHIAYDSYHALAYLHPARFSPDAARLGDLPQDTAGKRVFVRFVSHGAIHDVGEADLSEARKLALVERLSDCAEVLISAEGALPAELEAMRVKIPLPDIHHLLGFSDLVIGESATMCAEAAMLGTPSIYIDNQSRGYIDDLSERYGLCFRFAPGELDKALDAALEILSPENPREAFEAAHRQMLTEKLDACAYQLVQMDRLVDAQPRSTTNHQ